MSFKEQLVVGWTISQKGSTIQLVEDSTHLISNNCATGTQSLGSSERVNRLRMVERPFDRRVSCEQYTKKQSWTICWLGDNYNSKTSYTASKRTGANGNEFFQKKKTAPNGRTLNCQCIFGRAQLFQHIGRKKFERTKCGLGLLFYQGLFAPNQEVTKATKAHLMTLVENTSGQVIATRKVSRIGWFDDERKNDGIQQTGYYYVEEWKIWEKGVQRTIHTRLWMAKKLLRKKMASRGEPSVC